MTVEGCDFETLLALAEQMPRERFEQIKITRPNFAAWLDLQHAAVCMKRPCAPWQQALSLAASNLSARG